MIELLHCDCMEYMATVPDKYFDLAIVDPPYGIGAHKQIGFGNSRNGTEKRQNGLVVLGIMKNLAMNILTNCFA